MSGVRGEDVRGQGEGGRMPEVRGGGGARGRMSGVRGDLELGATPSSPGTSFSWSSFFRAGGRGGGGGGRRGKEREEGYIDDYGSDEDDENDGMG